MPLIRPRPGDKDWAGFCEWIRVFLTVEPGSGYVVYRPRDASHFHYSDDAAAFAAEWNAGSAGRPIRVYRRRGYWAYVRVDGMLAAWTSVRLALGLVEKLPRGKDPNMMMPDPETLTDAEVVRWWGIDYALMRENMKQKNKEQKEKIFEAAVARYEARIGRALDANEKVLARSAVAKL